MSADAMQTKLGRIRWKCRRGMLELDLLLLDFVEHRFLKLTAEQQQDFERLLAEDDPVLYAWLMGQQQPDDAAYAALIKTISSYRERGNAGKKT